MPALENRGGSVMMGGVQWGPDRYPTLWIRVDGERYALSLGRLAAYAAGEIDHPREEVDPTQVHHVDGDGWNNQHDNLEGMDPLKHAQLSGRRGARADGGER